MKKRLTRNIIRLASIVTTIVFSFSSLAFAATYNDVPEEHWAYKAIDKVSEKEIIVGDSKGNFKPDKQLDKFETSRILAKLASYKNRIRTLEEELYYESCYKNNKELLDQYSSKWEKWNSSYDEEIAFLLEEKILLPEDLNQFVVIHEDVERLRALSREEISVFMIRLMGKQEDALKFKASFEFNDDDDIYEEFKPYVYYAQGIGILNADKNNNFSPKGDVSKASMAVLIERVMKIIDNENLYTPEKDATSNNNITQIDTFEGRIYEIYDTANAIKIISNNSKYNNKVFVVNKKAVISIDGLLGEFSDLKPGMIFTGVFSNDDLISINAITVDFLDDDLESIDPENNDYLEETDDFGEYVLEIPSIDYANTNSYNTIVYSQEIRDDGNKIEVQTFMFNEDGTAITERTVFLVSDNCVITKDGNKSNFYDISPGDILIININNNIVNKIDIKQGDWEVEGMIIDINYDNEKQTSIFTVIDDKNNIYYFKDNLETKVYKNDVSPYDYLKTSDLEIGDIIEITSNKNFVKEIYSFGNRKYIDFTLKGIYISDTSCELRGIDHFGRVQSYKYDPDKINMNGIKPGGKVKLKIENKEIESILILEEE